MNVNILLQFITDHWAMTAAFAVLLILVLSYDRINTHFSGFSITPQELVNLINRERAVIIDIRSVDLFRQGHIINAVNFPAAKVLKDLGQLNAYKGRVIAIIGQREQESMKLARALVKYGQFEKIKLLSGGMVSWTENNLPIEKEKGKS